MPGFLDDEQALLRDIGKVDSYFDENGQNPLPYSRPRSALFQAQGNAIQMSRQLFAANHRQPFPFSQPLLTANENDDYEFPGETLLDDYGISSSKASISTDLYQDRALLAGTNNRQDSINADYRVDRNRGRVSLPSHTAPSYPQSPLLQQSIRQRQQQEGGRSSECRVKPEITSPSGLNYKGLQGHHMYFGITFHARIAR